METPSLRISILTGKCQPYSLPVVSLLSCLNTFVTSFTPLSYSLTGLYHEVNIREIASLLFCR